MKQSARIVTWYALLVAPMIAALYSNGSYLSATMGIVATLVISIIAGHNIATLVRENRKIRQELDETGRIKKDFLSHVSHELKAPLASMQETSHLMLERIPGPLTEKQERLLQLNLQSGKRLAAMIGNLLDLSRLEAGVVDYEMQLQDVGEIAQSVVVEVSPGADEKSIRLTSDIPREPLPVQCDPNRMVQIFMNLLDNAIRFSAKGGIVSLQIRSIQIPPARAAGIVTSAEGYISITIGDSGSGIEDDHKEAVFDSFHHVKQGKKAVGQSLGLGLAISRALIQAHKGVIWIEDGADGGSVFCVLLPKAKAEPASAMSRAS